MKSIQKFFIVAGILLLLAWHLAQPINLTTIDLGRHLKNGQLLLQGVGDVLYKNYYSYTFTEYPFINHHWLFGVLAFLIFSCVGFLGLSIVYVLIQTVAFYIFFRRTNSSVDLPLSCAWVLLSIPLVAFRSEIRPEGLSILFCALQWMCLDHFLKGKLKENQLRIVLIVLQVLWVNTHVFYLMGLLMVFLSWAQAKADHIDDKARILQDCLWLMLLACLINPSGSWGVIWPLGHLAGLGYQVSEEQNIFHIIRYYSRNPIGWYFLINLILGLAPWVFVIKRDGIRKHIFNFGMIFILSLTAIKAVRLVGVYGFFAIPLGAYAWQEILKDTVKRTREFVVGGLLAIGLIVSIFLYPNWCSVPHFGLVKGNERAAQFFNEEHIKGPIFNNFDIGGYLIFYLDKKEKLFVDNRPEAYPQEFFSKVYIPMQLNDTIWQQMQEQHHFNVIFFARNDLTRWGHRFIIRRLQDPLWQVVFIDDNTIIFVKNDPKNSDILNRNKLNILMVKAKPA